MVAKINRTPKQLPWSVAIPLKESYFKPLLQKDACFNVATDLSKIGSFWGVKNKASLLCYSDLQANADTNYCRRLGSGRSGFYKGHYLKGIGRTTLVGNWNESTDLYHNSGLLFASGAIREYLISVLLRSTGHSHLINPCTGILLGNLPSASKEHANFALRSSLISPIDHQFQSISVKKEGFARFSNFAWWLNQFPQSAHFGHHSGIAHFFALFSNFLVDSNSNKIDYKTDAELIVERLSRTIENSVENFLTTWSLGVRFGSYQNNFTLDGRFLDLETPSVMPRPLIALMAMKSRVGNKQKIIVTPKENLFGFEVFYYIKQTRIFLSFLKLKLNFIKDIGNVDSHEEKQFINEFLIELERKINSKHLLYSTEKLEEKVLPFLVTTLKVGKKEESELKELFLYHAINFNKEHWVKRTASKPLVLYRLKTEPRAKSEPHFETSCFVPKYLVDSNLCDYKKNLAWNEQIIELDNMTKKNKIFDLIQKIEVKKSP